MRRKVFLLNKYYYDLIQQIISSAIGVIARPFFVTLFLISFFCPSIVFSQQPVPGIKLNGQIVRNGDTIDICIGSSVLYESLAQGGTVGWKFNLGSPAIGTGNGPFAVVYNNAGVDSTVQTVISGFDTTSTYVIIKVNDLKPTSSFTFTQSDSCGNVPVVFNSDGSQPNAGPLQYQWFFGDGGIDTFPNPSYPFLNAAGSTGNQEYQVQLVVKNSLNCYDTTTRTIVVKKIPDASVESADTRVSFSTYNNIPTFASCTNTPSYLFRFRNISTTIGINTSYTISWGDGSPDTVFSSWPSTVIIGHPYTIGQHVLTLTVNGSTGCKGIKKYNIFLGTNPAGGFASPGNTDICAPGNLSFIVSGFANNTNGTTYTISINDGSAPVTYNHPPPDTIKHFFANTSCGNTTSTYNNSFSATLVIANPCRTTSVDVKPIFVSTKPKAEMGIFPSNSICTNSTVRFSNISLGGSTVTSAGNTSTCSNNGKQVWEISPSTGYRITSGNLGETNGYPDNSVFWTNGSAVINVVFTVPGTYTIRLKPGTDRCGVDEVVRTICVRNPPIASFTMDKHSSCEAETVTLLNTSPAGGCNGDSYNWTVTYNDPMNCGSSSNFSFMNGTNAGTKDPFIRFTNPGQYIVKLTVTALNTSFTCSPATYQDTFWVKAKPAVVINPISTVCLGNPITPAAIASNCYGSDFATFNWVFSGGTPETSSQLSPGSVMYPSIGTFPVILHATNECGTASDTVEAIMAATPAANAGPDKVVCSNTSVRIGASTAQRLTYQWTPAAGLSDPAVAEPIATLSYTGPRSDTTYTFVVRASAGQNCSGSDTVRIKVNKNPVVIVNPVSASVCAGSGTQLTASGAATYIWSPVAGLSSPAGETVTASPASSTTYQVTGRDTEGCSSTASTTVSVIPYPIVNVGQEITVCNSSTSIRLGGTPTGGSWSGSPYVTSSGVFNPNAAGIGEYLLSYSVSNGNCSRSADLKVTVTGAPVVSAGNDTLVCQSNIPIRLTGNPSNGRWRGSNFINTSGDFTPSSPGTYMLIYTFGDGSCVVSDSVMITVTGGIVNNTISGNQSICTGNLPALITGQLASGGLTEPGYQWQVSSDNFNWNNIPGSVGVDYQPAVLGQKTFFRRIASTSVCFGSQANASLPVTIEVIPDAQAEFNPLLTIGCPPFVITPAILNLTPHNNVGEYRWYINGDFYVRGQTFPSYTIRNVGDSITVKLVTTSSSGCKSDSIEVGFKTVEVPVPSFSLSETDGCGPLRVLVTNTTPNAELYNHEWDFGQGEIRNLVNPGTITFPINPNFGDTVYTITMRTFTPCDTFIQTQTVTVRAQPKVLFTPDRTEGCSPMRVNFSNTSRGSNANYSWDFNDGSLPVATNQASIQHTFIVGSVDTFRVKLKGTNTCGSDSLLYSIVVNPNSIRIDFAVNGSDRFGCAPHTVSFVNNTSGANSFAWNFGDGNVLNTNKEIDTVVHTYNTAGDYNVTLLAANSCNDTTDTERITVQIKPKVAFTASQLIVCVTDTIHFSNSSDPGISTFWQFGDGTNTAIREPVKVYKTPGTYRILLTGSRSFTQGLSCSDSAFVEVLVRDTLPGSLTISDSVGGCTPFTVTFTNSDPTSGLTAWTFGDGSTTNGNNVTHTFTSAGTFAVTMISRGTGGCTNKAIKFISVNAPVGYLLYEKGWVCLSSPLRFELRGTNATSYRFVFGDGDSVTSSSPVVFHQYTQPGLYVPYAFMIAGGCQVKVSTGDTIKVDNIRAGFRPVLQLNCGSTTVQLFDTSSAYFGIERWQWNFGDGTTSSLRNPMKVFNQSGRYTINLVVTGSSGCTDTFSSPIDIVLRNFPVSNIGSDSIACTGQPVPMAALVLSQDSVANFSWNFGNNVTGSGLNVNPVYNTSGIYTIRLISTTIYGCADTVFKNIRIHASPIVNAGADANICSGQAIQLQAFGANQWQWSPLEALSCTSCANPVATPAVSTLFVVRGTNGLGCTVSDSVLIQVVQPLNLTISANDSICVGEQTQLFVSGATHYLWSPAAGLSSASADNPIARPSVTTRYQVIGRDDYNCFVDTATVTVAVGNYPTINLGSGVQVVAGTNVPLNPTLTNGPFIKYTWTPNTDLSCTNCANPVATIKNNISYRLEVENNFGCKATDTINYTVTCEEAQQLYVPNAFSPDGDGLNDVLMVRGKGLSSVKYFRIFNRWGQLVFERNNVAANDASHGWDGKVNGVVATSDVYVYTVEVVCTAGANFVKKGNVTLFR